MKTLRNHAERPASIALVADEVLEFHAGRLLLLLSVCGTKGTINGLTKMAKLDFFVRYPDFFAAATSERNHTAPNRTQAVEAAMIRHHYGPWDKRYYHVLAYLEARDLIVIRKTGKSIRISLTKLGEKLAKRLAASAPFTELARHMADVSQSFSSKTGNELKTLVYKIFDEEVGQRPLGQVIAAEKP